MSSLKFSEIIKKKNNWTVVSCSFAWHIKSYQFIMNPLNNIYLFELHVGVESIKQNLLTYTLPEKTQNS